MCPLVLRPDQGASQEMVQFERVRKQGEGRSVPGALAEACPIKGEKNWRLNCPHAPQLSESEQGIWNADKRAAANALKSFVM